MCFINSEKDSPLGQTVLPPEPFPFFENPRFFTHPLQSHIWHLYHIIILFSNYGNGFLKVLTMVLGEYDMESTFLENEESFWLTKLVFLIFALNLSVILMNLVLGLAVNDIESLR